TRGSAANRLSPAAPKAPARARLSTVKVLTIPAPKRITRRKPLSDRCSAPEKLAMVTGTIGKTQCVNSESRPVLAASQRKLELMLSPRCELRRRAYRVVAEDK